jgi:hypothetical protein
MLFRTCLNLYGNACQVLLNNFFSEKIEEKSAFYLTVLLNRLRYMASDSSDIAMSK